MSRCDMRLVLSKTLVWKMHVNVDVEMEDVCTVALCNTCRTL